MLKQIGFVILNAVDLILDFYSSANKFERNKLFLSKL